MSSLREEERREKGIAFLDTTGEYYPPTHTHTPVLHERPGPLRSLLPPLDPAPLPIPNPQYQGFPGGSDGKESTCNAGDPGPIPGLGRSTGEGNGIVLQYAGLENSVDRGARWATVHGVAKSQTRLFSEQLTLSLSLPNPRSGAAASLQPSDRFSHNYLNIK